MFELQLNLCERFQGLSPFEIRRTRFREVMLLVKRLNNHVAKSSTKTKPGRIMKPAGDDWF